jgi:uncharacterized membrane protein
MNATLWIILAGAVVTYLTRIGGHLVLSRFQRIHPRIEAALDAVPAAVLTALIAPLTAMAGPMEWAALVVAALVALCGGGLSTIFFSGAAVLILLRNLPL